MRKIFRRVFGKSVGAFIAPTRNVEFLGILCEKSIFADLSAPMLLFADLEAKQYGTSYGAYYTMTDASTSTSVAPSLVSAVAPAGVAQPVATGKKPGRKAWRQMEIAF